MSKRSGSIKNFQVIAQFISNRWTNKRNDLLTKVTFFKAISKAICILVLNVFLEGTKSSFTYNGQVSFQ